MEMFSQTFGFVAAISAGIILLTVFFTLVGFVKRSLNPPAILTTKATKGFLNESKFVNIHMSGGKTLERMKLIGFMDHDSVKGGRIPYQLTNMVVLETVKGARVLLRADAVKMIEEID